MMKNLALTVLITCSLSACTTVVDVHNPVDCLGQPKISLGLTQEEYDGTSKAVLDKVIIFATALRARIDSQCTINKAHDEMHGDEK